MSTMNLSSKSSQVGNAPTPEQLASLPIDAPRQFPMFELWNLPYGAHLIPPSPLGCGIHKPQDYDTNEEVDHWDTCIYNTKLSILDGSVGLSRLHDALDLTDRTARSRNSRTAIKRVRFSVNSTATISEKRKISYFAADLDYEDVLPEADRIAYYCANKRCGCRVNKFFRTVYEHDEHVRERRAAESSGSDMSEDKRESGIKTKSRGRQVIWKVSGSYGRGSTERKRKHGEVYPPMLKRGVARETSRREWS